jgi:SP family facilitated glucose transporter-like MFS transporter 8
MVQETSEPRIAAMPTATTFLCHSSGILLVYILGAAMEWNTASGVITAFPLLSLVAIVLSPESPVWLVKNNRIQKAEKALGWLRGGAGEVQVRGMRQRCGL